MIVEDFGGVHAIARELDTDMKAGLNASKAELEERRSVFGKNSFPPPKIKTIYELVMENFDDKINVILLCAAVVSIVIGLFQNGFPKGLIEGVSIIISLMIIIIVNSGNNYASERRLADLVNLSEKQDVAVFRGNEKETITLDSSELVVGDVIHFEGGMSAPADMLVLEGQDIETLEVELTGEADGIEKIAINEHNYTQGGMCTILAKSKFQKGTGKALVIAVGPYTVAGVITEKSQVETQPTLLQQKLETIANKIGNFGIACAILTFCAMLVRTMLEMINVIPCGCQNIMNCVEDPKCTQLSFEFTMKNRLWKMVLDTVIIAITIIVVAIPEGLPLAVTISLSFSSKQMMKLNNLVRKLASSETMGGATHICSDKTGTLTQNKMTVMGFMSLQKLYQAEVGDPDNESKKLAKNVHESLGSSWDALIRGIMWNSSARIELNDHKDPNEKGEYVTRGNVTEQGIMKFFMAIEGGAGCLSVKHELADENLLQVISFSSSRKRASVVVRNPNESGDKEVRVYTKGAPDMLFDKLVGVVNEQGEVLDMMDESTAPH